MRELFVIDGCNGAGKTTASFIILPEILDCKEFVNADEIARGLSPFQPEKVNVAAGKLMINRLNELLKSGDNFAVESTLSGKLIYDFTKKAKAVGYKVNLVFFNLNSPQLAVEGGRVRVKEGGHHIPKDVICRRYERGLFNFFNLYKESVDYWMMINNSGVPYEMIAEGDKYETRVGDHLKWNELKSKFYER